MFETIAMLTMLLDHVRLVFSPTNMILFLIGRIAMPLYAFGIVQGFKYTRDIKKYFFRLTALAIISQFFYAPLLDNGKLNIIFTFIAALIVILLFQKVKIHIILKTFIFFIICTLLENFNFEAGSYTLILVFIYLSGTKLVLKHFLLNVLFFLLLRHEASLLQFASLIGTAIIVLLKNKPLLGIKRNFYRIFYPLHLGALLILEIIK